MALMRFRLDGIAAFRNKDQDAGIRHFCVDCAREARGEHTLIPFLDGQLGATLSDFGKDLGAMILCDKCGEMIATYYPDTFWAGHKAGEGADHQSLIFRKFQADSGSIS